MNILVISSNYPSKSFPNHGAFVYNLMQELGKSNQITIISPNKIHNFYKKKSKGYGDEICDVKRPYYFSFSNKKLFGFDFEKLTSESYKNSVLKSLHELKTKPDVIYCHFLSNAIPILDYAIKEKISLVVASGESSYENFKNYPKQLKEALISSITRVICVSRENEVQLINLGFEKEKIQVIPNAVNYNLFKPMNKNVCKANLGIDEDKFTIGFIGHFIDRKGPNRVIEAIKLLNDSNIKLVCVGDGGQLLENNFTTKILPVPNYELPNIFNAFDIFVLPTLHEGHCNAIEEAKACTIPIISSKGTSVEEQIDETTGILIDPLNIKEISNAIFELKNNSKLLKSLENNLYLKRGENSIQERGKRINSILESVLTRN